MIRNSTLAIALAGALAIGGAGVLYAQAEQKAMGMSGMPGMMQDCPMMTAMAQGPVAALHHAEMLGLTSDQVERLESLRDETGAARRSAMERMRGIHEAIAAAAAGESFDEPALREAFGRMGDLHEEIGVAMLRARHRTSQVLTAEQRETLGSLRPVPMEMMGSMGAMHGTEGDRGMGMMRMMADCPMMRHGAGHGAAEGHGSGVHGQ